jgi:tRNA/rRNA methyltransferase
MNQPQTDTPLFNRLRFVLVETSRPGNIGSAARAIKNMGFSRAGAGQSARCRCIDSMKRPVAFASGAHDVLASARR